MPENLRVPKRTGTHADVLLAVGLADLAGEVFPREQIRLRDEGDAFIVQIPGPLAPEALERLPHLPGYRFIAEKGEKGPPGVPVCDYDALRGRAQRYREQAQALRKAGKQSAEIRQLLQADRPEPRWRREQVVRVLQGHQTCNKLAQQIAELGDTDFRHQVSAGLQRMLSGEASGLPWKVEQVQVFNPPAAKGYARLKPDSTGRNDGTRDAWADPFVEWLRVRGYYQVATSFFVGSKAEHIRLLAVIPADLSLMALGVVSAELHEAGIGSSSQPKVDVLAALAVARILVERCEENQAAMQGGPPILRLWERRPCDAISGIYITHYQSLGQSRAVGALQHIGVPGWFAVESPQDAQAWLEVLKEHRAAVLSLDDQRSDEIGILIAYRRFLQTSDRGTGDGVAEAFLDFLGQYGCFYLRARERERRVRQFTTQTVRRVLMGTTDSYTAILDNPGFAAVAQAVRRATVNAQAMRAMGQTKVREIRYDLLPDLRRKRSLSDDEFMESVAEFVSHYNVENARRREQGLRAPQNVTTEEFHAFAALVEQHHAAKVGALLCAYGACRDPREQAPDTTEPQAEAADEPLSDEE